MYTALECITGKHAQLNASAAAAAADAGASYPSPPSSTTIGVLTRAAAAAGHRLYDWPRRRAARNAS
jgi:CRISPR/Cas system-associated protein Cas5 (RAMP superfamily)